MTARRRPLVRSYDAENTEKAVAHVRRGGHAIVWETKSRAKLVFQRPAADNPDDYGAWAVYDMRKWRWSNPKDGPFAGLSTMVVPKDSHWIVNQRVERDSVHRGSTRPFDIDCLDCGACCHQNEVSLLPDDIARFKKAGRAELAKPPYAKRQKDGRILLTLLPNGRCQHLGSTNHCAIYEIRPFPCSEFPMGSECCLSARATVMDVFDGKVPADA